MHDAVWSYLLTQAWRHFEAACGKPARDAALETQLAGDAQLSLSGKIQRRAQTLAGPAGVSLALQTVRRRWRYAQIACLGVAAILGLLTSGLIPEGLPARANVLLLLGTLLLPNLVSLALWILLQGLSAVGCLPVAPPGLGRAVVRLLAFLPASRDPPAQAARRAMVEFYTLTQAGRWSLAVFAHACWGAALAGTMLGCWLLLLARQVDFYWGSTLLDPTAMQALLHTLGQPLALLEWPVPTVSEITASRIDMLSQDPILRQRWGYFALGALLIYGLLPRLACLCGSAVLRSWYSRTLQLDLQAPDFWRLGVLLATRPAAAAVLDADRAPPVSGVALLPAGEIRVPVGSAWLALERPLTVPGDCARDFGCIANRADQARVLTALSPHPPWPALIVQAALGSTPDRGVGKFLGRAAKLAGCPVYLRVVDSPETADWNPAQCCARLDDWATLAAEAGLDRAQFAPAKSILTLCYP